MQKLNTSLPWEKTLGALPEMLETAWGSLFKALALQERDRLLTRGSTTSVGLAAAAIAKSHGALVISTTGNPQKGDTLRASGADRVVIDSGAVAQDVREVSPGGVDKVLELIGTTTLKDSLHCAKQGSVMCMTSIVSNHWSFENFSPMDVIPSTVKLTRYDGGVDEFMSTPYDELLNQVTAGMLRNAVGKVFELADIVETHTGTWKKTRPAERPLY